MFWVSLQKGAFGTPSADLYTLANYGEVFSDPFVYRVLPQYAHFHRHRDVGRAAFRFAHRLAGGANDHPGKTLIYAIMTLGLLIPGIYTAMGWTMIAHPRIGILNRWLIDLFELMPTRRSISPRPSAWASFKD